MRAYCETITPNDTTSGTTIPDFGSGAGSIPQSGATLPLRGFFSSDWTAFSRWVPTLGSRCTLTSTSQVLKITTCCLRVLIWQLIHLDARVGGGGCRHYGEHGDPNHQKKSPFLHGKGHMSAPTIPITTFTGLYTAATRAIHNVVTLWRHSRTFDMSPCG